MKNLLRYGICLFAIALISCESWLDVKPIDRISGRELFTTREGFVKALNGVYTELNNRNIYGREMTAGVLDIMAQYYTGNSNFYDQVKKYNYADVNYGFGKIFEELWAKSYFLIANLNIIIEECGEGNDALNDRWFGIIKGEALAMRAFLHLDLLRIFGPSHSTDTKGLYLPYAKNTDQTVSPLLSSAQIRTLLIDDLTTAVSLLKSNDPIIEGGVMMSDAADGDNTLRYRQFRMNYFAAKALLARAYLWFGDKSEAYSTATELIGEMVDTFPFINTATALTNRVFSTEVMFAAFDVDRQEKIFDHYFSPTESYTGNFGQDYINMAYIGNEKMSGRISQLFITENDIRYKAWFGSAKNSSNDDIYYINKYEGAYNGNYKYTAMIPLIRIAEVYLIAAETATDIDEGRVYLNTLRTARFAYDLDTSDREKLLNAIQWEYRREFVGEGQMFFFYKRNAQSVIPAGEYASETETLTMTASQYVVPMPENEANLRLE